jgi:hypothetical protein
MTREKTLFVITNVIMILSGYILLELLFGNKKAEDPMHQAEEINKRALVESYKKMKEQYPEIANG